jgi:LytS/YehU family sensor histidine kinase
MKFVKQFWSLILLVLCLILGIILGKDADIRINSILFFLILFGFVFLIQFLLLKKKTAQLEKAHLQNELELLKSQIDPHFYFNTLNNLYGLASRKSDKTANAIMKLSEIMRYVIYKGKKPKVNLDEEIKYIENYIELQELRINKELDIRFEKDIEDINKIIAPLLLIIPIENAFKHGVDRLLHKAFVHIFLIEKNNEISFEVKNNFDASELSKSKGIGLQNLRKRLELLYGNNFVLTTNTENDLYNFQLKIKNL